MTFAQAHQDTLTTRLRERARQLQAEIAAARGAGQPLQGDVNDRKDAADARASETMLDAEVDRDLAELRDVEAALARVADGSYGQCTECGEPIAAERLRALPSAAHCIACQSRAEQR